MRQILHMPSECPTTKRSSVLSDGTAIGEVSAMLRHIEEALAHLPLLSTEPVDKALVVTWKRRVELARAR